MTLRSRHAVVAIVIWRASRRRHAAPLSGSCFAAGARPAAPLLAPKCSLDQKVPTEFEAHSRRLSGVHVMLTRERSPCTASGGATWPMALSRFSFASALPALSTALLMRLGAGPGALAQLAHTTPATRKSSD